MASSKEFQIELEESQRTLTIRKNLYEEFINKYSNVLSEAKNLNEEQRELQKDLYEIMFGNSNLPKTVNALKTNSDVLRTLWMTFKSKLEIVEEKSQQFHNKIKELREKNQSIIDENYKNNIVTDIPNLLKMKNDLHEEMNQLKKQIEDERKDQEDKVNMKTEILIKLLNYKNVQNDQIRDDINVIKNNENQLKAIQEIAIEREKIIEKLTANCKELEETIVEGLN